MDGEEVKNGAGSLIAVAGLAVVRALHAHRASLKRREKLAESQPRQYSESLNAAIRHHSNGMHAEALRRYGELLRLSPNDPVVLTNAAQIWIDHGVSLHDAALALDLAAAAAADPATRAGVRLQRARLDLSSGRYSRAAAELTTLVTEFSDPRVDPAHTAWYLLGTCLAEMGDDAGAQRAFRTVLAHRPLAVHAWTALARLVAETDRPGAYALLEHGQGLIAPSGQGDLTARQSACTLLVEAALIALGPPQDHAQARGFLDRAARVCPESPYPPVNQAVIDDELHDLERFRRHIWEAVSKIPRTDQRLIAHMVSGAYSSEYGNLTLTALGQARLIDTAELRRRLAAWEHQRTERERSIVGRHNHYYNSIVTRDGAAISGVAIGLGGAPQAGREQKGSPMPGDSGDGDGGTS
ncbi:tetratricopeptide repeat protein [Sphaerisporangium sp. NBC_01403]|uniref:tetratricopeptide repeat protein n=1 Tax=Sphaerisporangium sp. NBC_01403 TaxID=2903599 RepID=UPI003244A0B4